MGYEPFRTLVDNKLKRLASSIADCSDTFSIDDYLFYVDIWFDGSEWKIEVRRYYKNRFGVYFISNVQVNLDDPLMFEKLEAFIGV